MPHCRSAKRPRPGNHAAGKIGANAGLVAKLHADIDGVGNHLNLVAMAQTAANVRGSGSSVRSPRRSWSTCDRNSDTAM